MFRKASILIKAAVYGIITSLFLTFATLCFMAVLLSISTSATKFMGVTMGSLLKTVQIILVTSYISSVTFLYVIFSGSEKNE